MLSPLKIRRIARCRHYHVSGRKCQSPEHARDTHRCTYHEQHDGKACAECLNMLNAFQPPKGW